jgi:sulfur relay protein TusB/DsrH
MKLAVFVSEYRLTADTLDRLSADKLGIVLVGNGVYHASTKENGTASALLEKSSEIYVLSEDLETRGLGDRDIADNVKVVNYGDVVDLIFNDYEKLAWL